MDHSVSGPHHHDVSPSQVNRAYITGITLNLIFVIIQVIAGLAVHSLSLLSDAGHNFTDVGALAISLLAFRLMKVKSTKQYTYGYRKTSVLIALFNAMILLVCIGGIVFEAFRRLLEPEPVSGLTISIVAGIGIVINSTTALMFLRDKEKDLNIRGAYLHLMSDAIISAGLVVGGVIIYFTKWFWVDSFVSIVVAVVIMISTWKLLRESVRLSLDGVPNEINIDEIEKEVSGIEGVKGFHHIHIWAISTTENALTAHLVISKTTDYQGEQKIKHELKHLLEHKKIHHITLETERDNEDCGTVPC